MTWLFLLTLACGWGDGEPWQSPRQRQVAENEALNLHVEELRDTLQPHYGPIGAALVRAAGQLPAPGSVGEAELEPLDPPLRYDEGARFDHQPTEGLNYVPRMPVLFRSEFAPSNFAVFDVQQLTEWRVFNSDTEFIWNTRYEDLLECLRATAADADQVARSFLTRRSAREDCEEAATVEYVIAMRPLTYQAPTVDLARETFTAGAIELEGFVIRVSTGVIERQFRVHATNGPTVEFGVRRVGGDAGDNPAEANLRARVHTELYSVLQPLAAGPSSEPSPTE